MEKNADLHNLMNSWESERDEMYLTLIIQSNNKLELKKILIDFEEMKMIMIMMMRIGTKHPYNLNSLSFTHSSQFHFPFKKFKNILRICFDVWLQRDINF
jgi:hypothetical protein